MLAESIPDATLLDWRKSPGEAVTRDEILLELETDKVVLEVPAPQDGVLSEVLKNTGDIALSEEVLARIDTEAAPSAGAKPTDGGTQPADKAPPAPAEPALPAGAAAALSPAVQRLITEHDLDASLVKGTGKGGRLMKADVLAYLESGISAPAPAPATPAARPAPPPAAAGPRDQARERREPMSRLRMRVAERLVEAQRTAAILTTFNEVDMQPVMELRKRYKDQFEKTHGVRLGFMSFFAKAAVQALERFPAVNAYIEGNDIVYHDYQDIGVAVGSPRGLVVPVLRDVAQMSFADIEGKIAEFGAMARDGTLTVEDMSGGTFTISNGGVFGSMLSTPILNPPQSAILGMHKTQERPMVVDGEIVVRPMMYLALSYDHRIIDGREAVLFLVAIKDAIAAPARLLLGV
jgi:2-oxoglutarate dehydrogenase E2 component (dihydrolipoamide succinyltransferase)